MSIKERFLIFPAILAYFYQGSYLQFVSIILSLKEIIILDCQLSRLTTIFIFLPLLANCYQFFTSRQVYFLCKSDFWVSIVFFIFLLLLAHFHLLFPLLSIKEIFYLGSIRYRIIQFFFSSGQFFYFYFFLRNTSNNALQISLKRLPS